MSTQRIPKPESHDQAWPFYSASFVLHVLGIGCLLLASRSSYQFMGLGLLAYSLGLRHAFDADHIAAIDNTVRKLIQQNKPANGVGFYFSLGHSTVVFIMSLVVGLSVKTAQQNLPMLSEIGGKIGSFVSGSFLILIALVNAVVLKSLFKALESVKHQQTDDEAALNDLLLSRGILSRILKPVLAMTHDAWQMYPVGFLFGLGFDTATEIALIGLSASAAEANVSLAGILALPIMFAAGMNVMDTTDSVMMAHAYHWAFSNPTRKIYYNVAVTLISTVTAFVIGMIELLQMGTANLATSRNVILSVIQHLDLSWLGYGLLVVLLGLWLLSYLREQHRHLS